MYFKNFGTCLKALLEHKGVSASELSRMMGFASRNSIFRILNNVSSYEKNAEFFNRLKSTDVLSLTSAEWDELAEGLEISRVGVESFFINQAMTALVMPMQSNKISRSYNVTFAGPKPLTQTLADALKPVFNSPKAHLTISGCCSLELFRIIGQHLSEAPVDTHLDITHYFDVCGLELVAAITAIQPVLYAQNYHGFVLRHELASSEIQALYHVNVLLADYEENDSHHYLHMVVAGPEEVQAYAHTSKATHQFFCHVYEAHKKKMHSVRTLFAQPIDLGAYLKYTEKYRRLEENANIFDIKMDVPINYIHPDILLNPLKAGFAENGFGAEDKCDRLIAAFYAVHLKRWQNFIRKRRVTHTIFTYSAMRSFALTGKQSDHFFAMRPYTPRERKAILCNLRELMIKKPYFTYYFFKPDLQPVQNEIGMYEGKGVLFLKGLTDYKLDGEHAEALITQPEFCEHFKDFFLHNLLVHAVTSTEETLRLTDELIALCDQLIESESKDIYNNYVS